MKSILKLGCTLMLYAVAACVGLAFVYSATEKTIAQNQQADLQAAIKDLFSEADDFDTISPEDRIKKNPDYRDVEFGDDQYKILQKTPQGNTVIGVAIRASGKSYGGPIVTLVGVGVDGTIKGVKILEHKDTPGLGANAGLPTYFVKKPSADNPSGTTFYGQFTGKSIQEPFQVKNDVIAITASTITSRAVAEAVKAAGIAGSRWLADNKGVSR